MPRKQSGNGRNPSAALRMANALSSFVRGILVQFPLVSRAADKKEDIKGARLLREEVRRAAGVAEDLGYSMKPSSRGELRATFPVATCCHELRQPHDSLFINAIGQTREICIRHARTFLAFTRTASWKSTVSSSCSVAFASPFSIRVCPAKGVSGFGSP